MRATPQLIEQRMREEGVSYAPYLSALFLAYDGEVKASLSLDQGLPLDWKEAVYWAIPQSTYASFDAIYRDLWAKGYPLTPGEFREVLSLYRDMFRVVAFGGWHETEESRRQGRIPDPRLSIPAKKGRVALYYASRPPYPSYGVIERQAPLLPERTMLRDDPEALLLFERQLSHEWEEVGLVAYKAARSRTRRGQKVERFATGLIVDALLHLQQRSDVEFRPWDGISPYHGGPSLLVDDHGVPLTHVRLKP